MRRYWLAATAAALALALASCSGGSEESASGSGDDDDGARGGAIAQATRGMTDSIAPAAPSTGEKGGASNETVPGGGGDEPSLPAIDPSRKIIFTANMALEAQDVGAAFNAASGLARSHGGYLEKSNLTNNTEDNTRRSGTMTIRVPVQNYDALISGLRGLTGVTVKSEGSNSNEVTEQYTDLQSRQRNLERTEQQYLELLKQAKSIQEILTVQDRLSSVRSQIEQIQGRLKVLDSLTDFATVNLTIEPIIGKAEEKDSGNWSLGEVFVESWERSLEAARYVAAAGVVAVVALAWLIVPLALLFLFARRARRRVHPPSPPAVATES